MQVKCMSALLNFPASITLRHVNPEFTMAVYLFLVASADILSPPPFLSLSSPTLYLLVCLSICLSPFLPPILPPSSLPPSLFFWSSQGPHLFQEKAASCFTFQNHFPRETQCCSPPTISTEEGPFPNEQKQSKNLKANLRKAACMVLVPVILFLGFVQLSNP